MPIPNSNMLIYFSATGVQKVILSSKVITMETQTLVVSVRDFTLRLTFGIRQLERHFLFHCSLFFCCFFLLSFVESQGNKSAGLVYLLLYSSEIWYSFMPLLGCHSTFIFPKKSHLCSDDKQREKRNCVKPYCGVGW